MAKNLMRRLKENKTKDIEVEVEYLKEPIKVVLSQDVFTQMNELDIKLGKLQNESANKMFGDKTAEDVVGKERLKQIEKEDKKISKIQDDKLREKKTEELKEKYANIESDIESDMAKSITIRQQSELQVFIKEESDKLYKETFYNIVDKDKLLKEAMGYTEVDEKEFVEYAIDNSKFEVDSDMNIVENGEVEMNLYELTMVRINRGFGSLFDNMYSGKEQEEGK